MPKPWIAKPLTLPVGDVTFEVQPIGYEDGLTLVAVGNDEHEVITKDSPDEVLYRLCMGDTWQQMIDAKCPYPVMVRAGLAAIQYQGALLNGLDTEAALAIAEPIWESTIDPEALAALMAANPTPPSSPPPATSKRSTGTASARGTRSRASTKATTSPKATPPRASRARAKAPRSVGKP